MIIISGLINIETNLKIEAFPIPYFPVRYPFFGAHTSVSGVGYNIANAFQTLGGEPFRFLSLIGNDPQARLVWDALAADGIDGEFVRPLLPETPQSVILYDGDGRRQINVDLKNIQEQPYPPDAFAAALNGCALAALCNINFSRPMLGVCRERGIPIATDVHALSALHDPYNRDFLAAADILFMSHEHLPTDPATWAARLLEQYHPRVFVIGLGKEGALLAVPGDRFIGRLPAVTARPVVNTIGAGDALFSAFLHSYLRSADPYDALKRATLFAAHKIGETGAAKGFLSGAALNALYQQHGAAITFQRCAA